MTTMSNGMRMRRWAPCLAASTLFALLALLYTFGFNTAYYLTIRTWGIFAWAFPFLDTDTVLSAVRCTQKGVDVYVANPCDPLRRVYDYSPLWLVIARVPRLGEWLRPIGFCVDLAFLASLTLLPAGRNWRTTRLIMLAVISSAAVYAVERGNNDLVIFVLAAIAATMLDRSRSLCLVAYGLALLAGLLKYYPMTLLAIAAREGPARFLAVAAGAAATLGLFLAIEGHDLVRALQLIPTGGYFGDMFGSVTFAGGLFQLFDWPVDYRWLPHLAMMLIAISQAILLGTRSGLQADLDRLISRERSFLLVGAILIPSYFFTAQNIGYRAVHLILVVPSLLALWQLAPGNRRYRFTAIAAIGLLWGEGISHAVVSLTRDFSEQVRNTAFLWYWLLREGSWWWFVTMLMSFAVAILIRSEMGEIFIGYARRLRPVRQEIAVA